MAGSMVSWGCEVLTGGELSESDRTMSQDMRLGIPPTHLPTTSPPFKCLGWNVVTTWVAC